MNNLSIINLFLITLSASSLFLLLFAISKLLRLYKRVDNIKEEEKERWQELEKKAQHDYQEIIETANKKAADIILQAEEVRNKSLDNFQASINELIQGQKNSLDTISREMSAKYSTQLNSAIDSNINVINNIYKDVEKEAKSRVTRYINVLEHQTYEAEKLAESRIREEYAKLEAEIKQERDLKLQELDEKLYHVIQKASKEIIGKSISPADHEALVIEALEKAKKEQSL